MNDEEENDSIDTIIRDKSRLESLRVKHNRQVKESYQVTDSGDFSNWLSSVWHSDDEIGFCEIPENETLSGNAYILEE